MRCEIYQQCRFFTNEMKRMPNTVQFYRSKYCNFECERCARHMVYVVLGPSGVPIDLYPDQVDRAKLILASR